MQADGQTSDNFLPMESKGITKRDFPFLWKISFVFVFRDKNRLENGVSEWQAYDTICFFIKKLFAESTPCAPFLVIHTIHITGTSTVSAFQGSIAIF